ncbi:hypothetical protein [Geovibrio ferrireducens]|uniref:hypothetical protein n=1 Tax=Geovibrio ferrireducens TaxID=46201 RepID=UPI002246F995|nr:hypothetical protein [Geovibrio ferrireducens]
MATNEKLSKTKKEHPAAEKKQAVCVYVGPSVNGLNSGTVFKNGLTETAEKIIKKDPLYKLLFPVVSDLASVRREIKDGGLRKDIYNKLKGDKI